MPSDMTREEWREAGACLGELVENFSCRLQVEQAEGGFLDCGGTLEPLYLSPRLK